MSYNPYARRKYGNKKTVLDGMEFDSKKEARRYAELKMMEKAGMISDLECQKTFELIPKQRDENGKAVRNCEYIADFVYIDTKTGQRIVEDVKGMKTKDYIIKKKLMLKVYGITVKET